MRAMESRDLRLNQLDAAAIVAHATHIRRLALEMVTRARASQIRSALSAGRHCGAGWRLVWFRSLTYDNRTNLNKMARQLLDLGGK